MRSMDTDFRFMAISDFESELLSPSFVMDMEAEKKIILSLLGLLDDKSVEVQGKVCFYLFLFLFLFLIFFLIFLNFFFFFVDFVFCFLSLILLASSFFFFPFFLPLPSPFLLPSSFFLLLLLLQDGRLSSIISPKSKWKISRINPWKTHRWSSRKRRRRRKKKRKRRRKKRCCCCWFKWCFGFSSSFSW